MKFMIIISLLFLGACAPLGPQFEKLAEPEKDSALIYYYRPGRIIGGAVRYDVHENGKRITTLYNGGYTLHKSHAGNKHIDATTETTSVLDFTAENNNRYVVRGQVGMGILIGRPKLTLVDEKEAIEEIKDCRFILEDDENIISGE